MSNILILEDSKMYAKFLEKTLKHHDLFVFFNEDEAISHIINNEIDLIISTSLFNWKKVKDSDKEKYIPVIVVNSNYDQEQNKKFYEQEITSCIFRQSSEQFIISRVDNIIDRYDRIKSEIMKKQIEAVNATVGSIQHELNNKLTISGGFLSMLKRKYPDEEKFDKLIEANKYMVEVVRKLYTIREYKERPYATGSKIIDLDMD